MSSHSVSLPQRHVLQREVCESPPEKAARVPPDEELMERVQEGDHEAFGQIFDRHYPAVRSIARKMLRNSEDVADVIQESFLDVFQNARSFSSSKGTLKGWISCLAYHRSLKRLRCVTKRNWVQFGPSDAEFIQDLTVKPDRFIRTLDFRTCLDRALKTLHEKHQRTIALYFFEGQELSAIALQLGESLGNTRHCLYRGLAKLRNELVQKGLLRGYIEFEDRQSQDEVPG
jgi:RNA polymerase sigma-70 factor, ECF subfamily